MNFKYETGTHSKRRQSQWNAGTSFVTKGDERHRYTAAGRHRPTPNVLRVKSSLAEFRVIPVYPVVGKGQDDI